MSITERAEEILINNTDVLKAFKDAGYKTIEYTMERILTHPVSFRYNYIIKRKDDLEEIGLLVLNEKYFTLRCANDKYNIPLIFSRGNYNKEGIEKVLKDAKKMSELIDDKKKEF